MFSFFFFFLCGFFVVFFLVFFVFVSFFFLFFLFFLSPGGVVFLWITTSGFSASTPPEFESINVPISEGARRAEATPVLSRVTASPEFARESRV